MTPAQHYAIAEAHATFIREHHTRMSDRQLTRYLGLANLHAALASAHDVTAAEADALLEAAQAELGEEAKRLPPPGLNRRL